MPVKTKKVSKYNHLGELITEYKGVTEAATTNKVATLTIYNSIKLGSQVKGYYYKYTDAQHESYSAPANNSQLWEGANGMFNIDGWAKICY